jgi:hypothetical protein
VSLIVQFKNVKENINQFLIGFDTIIRKLIQIALIKQEPNANDTGNETNRI